VFRPPNKAASGRGQDVRVRSATIRCWRPKINTNGKISAEDRMKSVKKKVKESDRGKGERESYFSWR